MYSILSTTKFDPALNHQGPFFLLPYHLDRLVQTAHAHGWSTSLTYDELERVCSQAVNEFSGGSEPCRIRLLLDRSGTLTALPYPALPFSSDPTALSLFNPDDDPLPVDPLIAVYLDTQPTPSSIFTSTKTTSRAHYEQAQQRAGILPSDLAYRSEVLLYNSHLHITEASIRNVAFWRNSAWVTPPASTGCLPGVVRRWLLENNRIVEADEGFLTTDSIHQGDWVLLTNSVLGCQLGKITARDTVTNISTER